MFGLQADLSYKDVMYALCLEAVFLATAIVFVGLGLSEIRKGKPRVPNVVLIGFGAVLTVVSLYVTYIFILG